MVWGSLMRHVDGPQGDVTVERFHGKATTVQDVLFTNLDHNTTIGQDAERLIQHITGQRIEDDIDSASASSSQDVLTKGSVARIEDVVVVQAEGRFDEFSLVWRSNGCKDLKTQNDV